MAGFALHKVISVHDEIARTQREPLTELAETRQSLVQITGTVSQTSESARSEGDEDRETF